MSHNFSVESDEEFGFDSQFSIEAYRRLKSRGAETTYNKDRKAFTAMPNKRQNILQTFRSEQNALNSCENLDAPGTKLTVAQPVFGYSGESILRTQGQVTPNNYFVAKVNKVRRSRTLTPMEKFEKDMEQKRAMLEYCNLNPKPKHVRFKSRLTPDTRWLTEGGDTPAGTISTQTDDPNVTFSSVVLNRASLGMVPLNDNALSWNSSNVITSHLMSYPETVTSGHFRNTPPNRPSTNVVPRKQSNQTGYQLSRPIQSFDRLKTTEFVAPSRSKRRMDSLENFFLKKAEIQNLKVDRSQIEALAAKLRLSTKYR